MIRSVSFSMILVWGFLAGFTLSAQEPLSFFESSVAPILQRRCLECHSDDVNSGEISFQSADGFNPDDFLEVGSSAESYLIELISADKFGHAEMPKRRTALTKEQVDIVKRWIDDGADWPDGFRINVQRKLDTDWWSLQPLRRPEPPRPNTREDWVRNDIDRFVLAKLHDNKLQPSPMADPRTLIRRLYFDLIGLPPDFETVQAFVSDPGDEHYERIVDELLASPQYGERWARHWLDLVHYGDSHGFDKDKIRPHAWRYRDHVIQQLNQDLPWSAFVEQQLAGDAIQPEDKDGIIATGMIVAGPFDWVGHIEVANGTLEKKRIRNLDRDDMVATVMNALTSTTVQCARCHDHKFDPVSQLDYYRMQSVFAGIDRANRELPLSGKRTERMQELRVRRDETARRIENEKNAKRVLLDRIYHSRKTQIEQLRAEIATLASPLAGGEPVSNGFHSEMTLKQDEIRHVTLQLPEPSEIEFVVIHPARPTDFQDTPGFLFPKRWILELINERGESHVIADYRDTDFPNPGDQFLTFANEENGPWVKVRFIATRLSRRAESESQFAVALSEVQVFHNAKLISENSIVTATDSIDAGRWRSDYLVDGHTSRQPVVSGAERIRFARSLGDHHRLTQRYLNVLFDRQNSVARIREELSERLGQSDKLLAALQNQQDQLGKKIDEIILKHGLSFAAATDFKPEGSFLATKGAPRDVFLLMRGNEATPNLEIGPVSPGAISALQHLNHHFDLADDHREGERRKALAHWITDPENPLAWRSVVNRVWQHHFGVGLVSTSNDFGRMGSLPTHPDLLDWLAVEFRDSGGQLKALHKQIVMSATWRQSSGHDQHKASVDSGNRLLWRMNRRRLDVEQIRDSMLAVSGKLNRTMYGPGYRPFELIDDHSPRFEYDKADFEDPAVFRRSVYRFIVRSVPEPFFESLDCADPSQITDRRSESITALQALTMMNNKLSLHLAECFADELPGDVTQQTWSAAIMAWGREPTDQEQQVLIDLAENSGMVAVCRTLFNSNEFVFVD